MIRLTRAWLARRRAAAEQQRTRARHLADKATYLREAREVSAAMDALPPDAILVRQEMHFRSMALYRRAFAARCRAEDMPEMADANIRIAESWERAHRAAAVRNGKRVCCGQVVEMQVERIG